MLLEERSIIYLESDWKVSFPKRNPVTIPQCANMRHFVSRSRSSKLWQKHKFFSTSLHEGRGFSPLILSLTWKVWAVFRKLQLDVNWRWIRFVSFFTSRDLSCGCFIFKFLLFSLTVLLPGVSHSRFFVSPRMLWHASRCPSRKEDRSENLGGSDSNGKQSLKATECPCGPRRRRYGRGRRKSTHV